MPAFPFAVDRLISRPMLRAPLEKRSLANLHWRDVVLNFEVTGSGRRITSVEVDGKEIEKSGAARIRLRG